MLGVVNAREDYLTGFHGFLTGGRTAGLAVPLRGGWACPLSQAGRGQVGEGLPEASPWHFLARLSAMRLRAAFCLSLLMRASLRRAYACRSDFIMMLLNGLCNVAVDKPVACGWIDEGHLFHTQPRSNTLNPQFFKSSGRRCRERRRNQFTP